MTELDVKIWCPEHTEFHDTTQDKEYDNIYVDCCNHIVAIGEPSFVTNYWKQIPKEWRKRGDNKE